MKKIFSIVLTLALLVTTFAPTAVFADEEVVLSMANVYANNMVLQANEDVLITGAATSGTTVTATFSDGENTYTEEAKAADSVFEITFDPFEPGYTEYTLTVTDGTTTLEYSNIVFGDVFLLSGQSNMEWDVRWYGYHTENAEEKALLNEKVATSENDYLRFMSITGNSENWSGTCLPKDNVDIEMNWTAANPETVLDCSAVGYFFGREIQAKRDYPVGLVCAALGGTSILSWLPDNNNNTFWGAFAAVCYNTAIYPFRNFNYKSILWYQGEYDSGSTVEEYYNKNMYLIEKYREVFGDIPFGMFQLPNCACENSQGIASYLNVREAQFEVFASHEESDSPNTVGLFSLIDQKYTTYTGNVGLHPEGKMEAASRAVIWADSVLYGGKGEYAGPVLNNAKVEDGKIVLTYDHVGTGLVAKDGSTTVGDYTVIDDNGYYEATGTITSSNTVTIETDVENPTYVQYAQNNINYSANLMNSDGLAAYPFIPVNLGNGGTLPPVPTATPTAAPEATEGTQPTATPVAATSDKFTLYSSYITQAESGAAYGTVTMDAASTDANARPYDSNGEHFVFMDNTAAGDGQIFTPNAGSLDGVNTKISVQYPCWSGSSDIAATVTYIENGETKTTTVAVSGSHDDNKQTNENGETWAIADIDIGTYPSVQSVRVYQVIDGSIMMQSVTFEVLSDGEVSIPTAAPEATAEPTAEPTEAPSVTRDYDFEMFARDSYSNAGKNDPYGTSQAIKLDADGNEVYYSSSSEPYGGGGWNMETYYGTENINLYTGLYGEGAGVLYTLNNCTQGYYTTVALRFIADYQKACYSALVTYDGGKTETVLVYDSTKEFTYNGEKWEGWGHIADVKIGTYPNLESVKIYISGAGYYDAHGSAFSTTYKLEGTVEGYVPPTPAPTPTPTPEPTATPVPTPRPTPSGDADIWDGTYDTSFLTWDGAVTEYIIDTPEKFAALVAVMSGLNPNGEGWHNGAIGGKKITLGADIYLNDTLTWDKNGKLENKDARPWPYNFTLSNEFDGNGYTIYGLYLDTAQSEAYYKGLFPAIWGGSVKDLTVANAYVTNTTGSELGIVTGRLTAGTLENVTVKDSYVYETGCSMGGLVCNVVKDGNTISNVTNCRVESTVTITGNDSGTIGGLVFGNGEGCIIENSTCAATITGTGNAGGIVAQNTGVIDGCGFTGKILWNGDEVWYNAAGIAVENGAWWNLSLVGTVKNCYVDGATIEHRGQSIGGLIASNRGSYVVQNNYVKDTTIRNECAGAAGLISYIAHDEGAISEVIENNYVDATTIKSGWNSAAALTNGEAGTLKNCYTTSSLVLSGSQNVTLTDCGTVTADYKLSNGSNVVDALNAWVTKAGTGYETWTLAADGPEFGTDSAEPGEPEVTYIAETGGVSYETLAAAVEAAADGATVKLLGDATGNGIVINKDITIDLGSYTYTVDGYTVGSTGTKTLGFQILKDNNVTIKNGTIAVATDEVKMLIQNYSNLTLENVTLDGTGSANMQYVLSNNCGNVAITGATSITAPEGAVAFDVYDYSSAGYTVPVVTVDTTGTITGAIEVSKTAKLTISSGIYTVPLDQNWCLDGFIPADNGDGTYGVKVGLSIALTETNVVTTGVEEAAVIVLASYNGTRLVDVQYVDITEDADMTISSTGLITEGATSISAMLLKDMANIMPLCAAAVK